MKVLIRQGWGSDVPAHRQFFTGLFIPDADDGAIRAFNEMQRISATADNVLALLSASPPEPPTSELLPLVTAPALVIHRRGDAVVPFERGRELAAGIPGARFLPLDGRNHAPLPGEPVLAVLWKAVDEFLGPAEAPDPAPPAPSGLVTILFTDMEGSTTLTQRLGDAAAQQLLRSHNTIIRDALNTHAGTEIKHTGDGIMASFGSASKALECAVAIQQAFEGQNTGVRAQQHQPGRSELEIPPDVAAPLRPDVPIRVRIGLNAGEPVAEDDPGGRSDLFGTAVQLAARVCAKAEGGQILAANVVRELAAGKGFLFSDRGDVALRGFEDPVRLYEVRW